MNKRLRIEITGLYLLWLCTSFTSAQLENKNHMSTSLIALEKQILLCRTDRSLPSLVEALRQINQISATPDDRTSELNSRGRITTAGINLVSIIDESIDPSFDQYSDKDAPSLSVTPPKGPDGLRYPTGINPNSVADPISREAYPAAIKLNHAKIERLNNQRRTLNLRRTTLISLKRHLLLNYKSFEQDKTEFNAIITNSALTVPQKREITDLFPR